MKKYLKWIIAAVLVVAIAVCAVILSGKFAFSGKDKVSNGLAKSFETINESSEIIEDSYSYKYLESIKDKPFSATVDISSIDLEINGAENYNANAAKIISAVADELKNTSISTKINVDKKNEVALLNMNLKDEDIIGEISGDAVIKSDSIAIRSNDLNEKYITINKNDLDDDEKMVFELIEKMFKSDLNAYKLTKEEAKYLKDRYSKIVKEFITNDMVKTENAEISVNSKTQKCTKSTVTLTGNNVKDLLKKLVESYKADTKGQEIIDRVLKALYPEELVKEMKEQINDTIDELSDINLPEDFKLEVVSYGSTLNTYALEFYITADEETLQLKEVFNDNSTDYILTFDNTEMATFTLKRSTDKVELNGKIKIEGYTANVTGLATKEQLSLKISAENIVDIEIACDSSVSKDTDKEFEGKENISIKFNVPMIKLNGHVKVGCDEKVNVLDKLDVPDTSNNVNITDNSGLQKYVQDCGTKLTKYAEKIQKSKIINDISRLYSSSAYSY